MSRLLGKKKRRFLRRSYSTPVVKDVSVSRSAAVRPSNSSSLRQRMSAERLGRVTSTESATVHGDADSNAAGNPNETLESSRLRSLTRRNSGKLNQINNLVKKGSKLRLRLHRSASFSREPTICSPVVELITSYLQVMDYPEHLQRKVHKKFRKYIKFVRMKKRLSSQNPKCKNSENKSPDVEVQVACDISADCDQSVEEKLILTNGETKYFQDAGALEEVILSALPTKNSIDCFWHLYGDTLCRSHLFFFDQNVGNPISTPLKPDPSFGGNSLCKSLPVNSAQQFLKNIAVLFRRENVMPGKYLAILPRGGVYVIRRGTARILVKGKCAAELHAGSVIESDVLYPGYISIYLPESKSSAGNVKGYSEKCIYLRAHVSICANSPIPSSSYVYGCEFGVLNRDDFDAVIESDRSCAPSVMREMRKNLENFKTFIRLKVKTQIEEDRKRADMMREKLELESRRVATKQLAVACMDGCLSRVIESLTAGASLEYCIDAESGRKAIHVATELQHIEILEFLLNNNEALVHSKDDNGQTALHICCAKSSSNSENVEMMIRLLANKGADVISQDIYGNTPLHLLAAKGDLKLLSFADSINIFKKKLDDTNKSKLSPLETKNKAGQTPLDVCRTQQARRILKPKTDLSGYDR
uniref:Cyclic nucleotide-binding domain-containing protein n=1 Tax=Aplanochytrium stocchinoi TaxID=215587 RepID=A0A7S3PM59_9STRA